jgi:hypothetical protein
MQMSAMIDLLPTTSVTSGGNHDQEIHSALDMGGYTDLALVFYVWSGTSVSLKILTAMENREERYAESSILLTATGVDAKQVYLTGPGALGSSDLASPARFVRARVVTSGAAVFEVKAMVRMR